ncbi:MAG: hypothetical protein K0A93_05240 [Desulfuromonadaceae bacterium]|nr:hypothetical protein [Desulfuromonadaceae bacterium]
MSIADFKAGFAPELVRRLQSALSADHEHLFQIILDPAPEVLRALLKNRNLAVDHLLALLKRRDLPEDLLKAIYRLELTGKNRELKLALVKNPATPGQIVLSLIPHLYLFELLNLCYLPGVTPDQKYAAERAIIKRLPEIPLGNKLTLARRGTTALLDALLKEGDPQLLDPCLSNPRLKEVSIVQFINGPQASAAAISAIARHPKWKSRPNLRTAILKNRRTPAIWFTLFLPQLRTPEINTLLISRQLSPAQKKLVATELKRRQGR